MIMTWHVYVRYESPSLLTALAYELLLMTKQGSSTRAAVSAESAQQAVRASQRGQV